jgi:beta-xylosidase
MKKISNILFPLLVLSFCTSLVVFSSCKNDDDPAPQDSRPKVPLADPFILLWDNQYYAYGTYAEEGIAVYVSDDLLNWSVPDGAVDGLALKKDDVWGSYYFWAPEVYHVNGKFYMYYSAEEHICVASSDSPLGPFVQDVQKPMIEDEKSIDNSLFIDEDGTPYLFFDRFDDGLNICVAELEDNLTDIKAGTTYRCIHVSQPWEKIWGTVNEGSFVIKHNDTYYMTYSANSYESKLYGIGVATASSVDGRWTKYADNPVLQKPGTLVGVGHSAMFTDKEGQFRIVFHAHNSTDEIHPRNMYISTVYFENEDGEEVLSIDENYIIPTLEE